MPHFICKTCGVQYADSATPPEICQICRDDRQYIGDNGQEWTTLAELQTTHHNTFETLEPDLTAIRTDPIFAIGQRAFFIQTPHGNVLWECHSLIDEATVEKIHQLGGLSAIALSHPHMYGVMVEWSQALGGIPILLHAENRAWVMRPDPLIEFWKEDTFSINPDLTLIRCGGHFTGSTVLHWSRGVLLSGDSIMVVADKNVSFMYSYPNYIPLNAAGVRGIVESIMPFDFERIYSNWPGRVTPANGKQVVIRSAERYIQHISD